MPFTLAHPAIVLPLLRINKKWFSLTGLFLGAMSPDLEYFVRMKVGAVYSHQLEKIPFVELPLALSFAFLFHLFVRNILIENLPSFFKSRTIKFLNFDWLNHFREHYLVIVLSVLIGAYSHIFLDAFTHEWGYFVKLFPILKTVLIHQPVEIALFKFLQHFSTLVGLIVIFYGFYHWPKNSFENERFNYKFWLKMLFLSLIIFSIRFFIRPDEFLIGNIIVTSMMSTFISLIVFGMLRKLNLKK